jgi:Holliday junction resolvase
MTTPQKAKGSQWERDVAGYLRENGFPMADRRYGAGVQQDKGDLVGVPNFALECKNQAKIDLAGFIEEAIIEARNANARFGAVIIKRRRKATKDAYVVMTLEQFAVLIKEKT